MAGMVAVLNSADLLWQVDIDGQNGRPADTTAVQRQIDANGWKIDRLLYKPYDLTHNEIHNVEETTQ